MLAHFNEKDIPLLENALDLIPDLSAVTIIAKYVGEQMTYPIKSIDVAKPHLKKMTALIKDRITFTFEQAEKFLPPEFFPIESQRDLLCRLLIAFQRGRLAHLLDRPKPTEGLPKGVTPTILPSPTLTIPDLVKLNDLLK